MDGNRLHTVSDPLSVPAVPLWFNFDQAFQIPNPASTDPLDSTSFDFDFFNPLSLSSSTGPSVNGEFALIQQMHRTNTKLSSSF